MILSVSRRTDIPAFYHQWFMGRVAAGFVMVRNPFNYDQISSISLRPNNVSCFVFWTRDAGPLIKHLPELDRIGYRYYFQYTITGYGKKLEPGVPSTATQVKTIKRLEEQIGKQKIIWRFDPIVLSDLESPDECIFRFEELCRELSKHVRYVTFSFADLYEKADKALNGTAPGYSFYKADDVPEMTRYIVKGVSTIAQAYGLPIVACAEGGDYTKFGVKRAQCVDPVLLKELFGMDVSAKDSNQRTQCGCVVSRDIGEYNLCRHRCVYCYACDQPGTIPRKCSEHNVDSPIISGWPPLDVENKQPVLF